MARENHICSLVIMALPFAVIISCSKSFVSTTRYYKSQGACVAQDYAGRTARKKLFSLLGMKYIYFLSTGCRMIRSSPEYDLGLSLRLERFPARLDPTVTTVALDSSFNEITAYPPHQDIGTRAHSFTSQTAATCTVISIGRKETQA